MKALRKFWSVAWRLGVAGLLMAWVLHAVFHDQCRTVLDAQHIDLDALPRGERWLLVWQLGPTQLGHTIITGVDRGWLTVSVVLWGLTIFLGAWRWWLVLRSQGLDPGLRRTLEISLVAHFFNSFLLGSTGGDLLKAYYAARVTHHLKTEAVTSVLLDRLLGLFAMLAFSTAMMLPNLTLIREGRPRTVLLAGAILGMAAAAGGVLAVSLRGGLSQFFPGARAWLRRLPKADLLERGLGAGRALGRARGLLGGAVVISLLLTVVCVLQLLSLVWAYGYTVPWTPIFFVVPAVICISALPVAPNGLGVRDYLYLYLLSLPAIGVSAGSAVAISLVAYAGSLVWSALGGVLYIFMRREQDLAEAMADERSDREGDGDGEGKGKE